MTSSPFAPPAPVAPNPTETSSFSPQSKVVSGRVLVVDDDLAVRLRARDLLETSGECEVEEAEDGAACLVAVARRPPDLILLDLMMPGMSGLEVCQRLRSDPRTREIPIIVLSAAHESEARPAALDAGAEDYLRKPIPARELRTKVANITRLNRFRSLQQERDRLRWLFEHSDEPLLRITRGGRLREANHQARVVFSLPEVADASAPPRSLPDAVCAIARHYRSDPPGILEQLAQGLPLSTRTFTLHRAETNLQAARWFVGQIHEDNESPDADLLLKFGERSQDVRHRIETWSFQRLLSHKLRTPINGVGPTLDLLLDDPELLAGPEARDFVQMARDSAQRLEETITSILGYHNALCGGSHPNHAASVPLAAWRDLLRTAAGEAGLAPDRVRISGDDSEAPPTHLQEPLRIVLMELFDNYMKFSHARSVGVEATLEHARLDRHTTLRLFAPGPSIPPDTLARIGRPYWQEEKLFTGEVPGAGLGLATCRLILGSLGGELSLAATDSPAGLVSTLRVPSSSS